MTAITAPEPLLGLARSLRLRRLLRVVGPAWIVMLADVDAPSIITAGKAGSEFAYASLLPILALIPILYLVQEMTARLGIVTGRGHAELVREHYGFGWAAIAVVSMLAVDLVAYVAEFAGIALGAQILGIGPGVAIGAALVLHSIWVLTGSYRRFEIITIALSLTLFGFLALAVGNHPDPGAVLGGLSPLQPLGNASYRELIVALIGACVMPWMLYYQQAASADKGLGRDDLAATRQETLIGATASQLLMGAIVVVAAAAMALPGNAVGGATSGLAALPEGLARLASGTPGVVIAIGLIGAGLLAAVVISLSAAWAWSELLGWPHSLNLSVRRAPGFYAVYVVEVVPAAVLVLLAPSLGQLVVGAMILNVVVLAIPLAFVIKLSSDRRLLGDLANSRRRAAVLWAVAAGLLLLGLDSLGHMLGFGR